MIVAGTLEVTTPSDRELQMTRVFNAPRSLVFDALTRPELLRRWFVGPPGWSLTTCELDPKVGGRYRYAWSKDDGTAMGLEGVFLEFTPPEKLVATEKFDESWYPGEAVATTALAEADGKTTLTLTVCYASKEALDAVLATPAAEGVAFTYDKLDEFLATLV